MTNKHPDMRYFGVLTLVLILAIIPRLWLWNDHGRAGVVLPGDQDEYYRGAIHLLLEGSYYDEGQWLRPPMTSLFLAAVFVLIGGVHLPTAMLVQCGVSIATLMVLAELARHLLGSARAGIVAALLGAIFLPYASYASQLLSETLFLFWITFGLLLLELTRQRGMNWRWVLASGGVWGLAALTRPVGVYALPFLMLWVAVRTKVSHAASPLSPRSRWGGWLRKVVRGGILLVGFLLVVAPWSVRNSVVFHRFVLVDTNGGMSFWLGNLLEPGERELQGVWNRSIPNVAERERVAVRRAIANIRREPLTFLKRMRYKIVSLWQLETRLFAANAPVGVTIDEQSLGFTLVSDIQYVCIMLLALVGAMLAQRWQWNAVVLLWPLYGTFLSAISLGHPRLRLPLLITPIVYAALPLAHPRHIWQRFRAAQWWRKGGLLLGLGVLSLLIYAKVYGPFFWSESWLALAHLGGGEPAIERAVAAYPVGYRPYVAWGNQWKARGDFSLALAAFEVAAERAPQNILIHLQRLDLARRLGRDQTAREAMDAIAAFGWENDLTNRYAWNRMPLPAVPTGPFPRSVHLDLPSPGAMQGVYPVETDGQRSFRWTMGNARIRLPLVGNRTQLASAFPSHLVLLMRADYPDTLVTVRWQWERVTRQRVETVGSAIPLTTVSVGPVWESITVPLSLPLLMGREVAGQTIYRGVLVVQAPTVVVSPRAPYPRGVALATVRLDLRRDRLAGEEHDGIHEF